MQNYCYIIGYMLQFFPENLKFQLFQFCSLLTDNFCHFLLKRQLKGKAIWVSFLTCGNDILIISRCVFRYLFSYLTGHLCFKNWEKPNGKVLRSKLSFKNILKIINSWQVKFSNDILFLLSFETWKHLKRVKDHLSVIFQNTWLYL